MSSLTTVWNYRTWILNLTRPELTSRYKRSVLGWMWSLIGDRLLDEFRESVDVADAEAAVLAGELPPAVAADRLLARFLS